MKLHEKIIVGIVGICGAAITAHTIWCQRKIVQASEEQNDLFKFDQLVSEDED